MVGRGLLVVALLGVGVLGADAGKPTLPAAASGPIDFVREVQPILQTQCVACHGANKHKGGLRLDTAEQMARGGDRGPILKRGDSAGSRLIHLVAGQDAKLKMPPRGPALSAVEVGKLRAWIDQGATWPAGVVIDAGDRHWAFQAVRRPTPPAVKDSKWVRNDIDRFVLARLEAAGVAPSAEAARSTLLRRLSLDLTGLPPTPEDVAHFAKDTSAEAYEKQVDRLLASPHFGENWARHWLDLARYADTDGYEKDLPRPFAWRWRNWVIDAINRDLPYDQFTIDQIAGDLLPNATLEQRVATGFHRNTLINREGGIDVEEDRAKSVVDRTNTVAAVWLGLTAGCAECHSHKYDPLSQREYFQLYAFFNNTDDREIFAPLAADAEQTARQQTAFMAARKKYLDAHRADRDFEAWTRKIARLPDVHWTLPDSYELPTFTGTDGVNLYPQQDGSFHVMGDVVLPQQFLVMGNTRLPRITAIRLEAMTDPMLPALGPGYGDAGDFVLTEFRVEASPLRAVTHLKKHEVAKAVADHEREGFELAQALDGDEKTGWAVGLPGLSMAGVDRCAVFTLKESIAHEGGTRIKISLVQRHDRKLALGRFRVTLTAGDPKELAGQAVPQRMRDLAARPTEKRTVEEQATLLRYYHATEKRTDEGFRTFTEAVHEWLGTVGAVRAQVLAERTVPRHAYIHLRGNFLRKGPAVTPNTPAVLPPLRADRTANRVDLARWLVDPANPLTARVEVNRIWANLFGEGIVRSLADFGTQGERPTHPELLDWLASEFVRLRWSRKALIKTIVMSATYRQSSRHRPELARRDARNRLLARQNRFRLSAELVRDQFLAASGLLDPEVGGASLPVTLKRRGLYVQYKRTKPDYMFATFDEPTATVTCPQRVRSNTPLQALTLLNDPLFVECSRALARRVMKDRRTRDEQLRHAFHLCTGRLPDDSELKSLRTLHDRAEAVYAEDNAVAGDVAGADLPLDVERSTAAALVLVARVVLNLDETIVRD
jgi:mono/diheme cytochrome c family protein